MNWEMVWSAALGFFIAGPVAVGLFLFGSMLKDMREADTPLRIQHSVNDIRHYHYKPKFMPYWMWRKFRVKRLVIKCLDDHNLYYLKVHKGDKRVEWFEDAVRKDGQRG